MTVQGTIATSSTRQRILDAAVELVTVSGFSSITMASLAEHAGVSRQTVYNEIGTKSDLADAVVLDELGRFLAVVESGFDQHPRALRPALRDAIEGVLERATDSALLRAVVAATNGADTELLPPLTTRASSLVEAATAVVDARIADYEVGAGPAARATVVDMLVRTVLSHVMQPSGDPRTTATRIADVVTTALDG
jgi:AcrR family transcriptional regulator